MSSDMLRRPRGGPVLLVLLLAASGCGGEPADSAPGFDVMEKSVRELGAALESER